VIYQYQPAWEDVRLVICREYFACEPATYVYMGRIQVQLAYTDDEMFALLWCARQKRVALGEVIDAYGQCNRSLAQVCARYGILPSSYYVQVDEKCDMSVRFKHLYIAHWSQRTTAHEYTNEEVISLLHVRFANEYYGIPADEYLRRETRGETFQYICLA